MKTALYGLSGETEKAINKLKNEFEILCLLDGFKVDGEMYGLPIFSINEAINKGIQRIIVVARPGSCKAITKRISSLCFEHNIELVDIRGNDLLQKTDVAYSFHSVKQYKKSELLSLINSADVVSFDLFDTLVVRNCCSSYDVVEIMATRLNEGDWFSANNICFDGFVDKRIAAEKQLSRGGKAPTLTEIYYEFIEDIEEADYLAKKEFEIDSSVLNPRHDMVEILKYANKLGKKIYITSDTYYSIEQIREILMYIHIDICPELMLSCEKGTSKTGQLYNLLQKDIGNNSIIHIGDDLVADKEMANACGVACFRIYSPAEMMDSLGYLGLEECVERLSDRIRIGMLEAEIFNSPFQFEEDECKVHIDIAEKVGFLLFAPIVMDFVYWFIDKTKNDRITNIWFGARDGFLIKQIYELLTQDFSTTYFLTSRTAAVRAGIETKQDVEYVDSMKYSGTLEDNIKSRFGFSPKEIVECEIDYEAEGLLRYLRTILNRAELARRNYQGYMDNLLSNEDNIAFFDFVAKGTAQLFLQKILKNHLRGYYFLQLEPEQMKDKEVEVVPFYTEEESAKSVIFDSYYILETILTSPESSLDGFDENLQPIYAEETRAPKDIDCVMRVQNGIKDYVQKYVSLCPKAEHRINKHMDEVILQLTSRLEIRDKEFMNLVVEDPFFNRMTEIADII